MNKYKRTLKTNQGDQQYKWLRFERPPQKDIKADQPMEYCNFFY